jgi:predicted DNA-binding WGR domain protein
MQKKILICSEEGSNKFWMYEHEDGEYVVTTRHGRLGTKGGKPTVKKFSDSYSRDDFIDRKTDEKYSKGYEDVTEEEFEIQTEIAKQIGTSSKIDEMKFVTEDDFVLSEVDKKKLHDPKIRAQVYARIIHRKEAHSELSPITELLFGPERSFRIEGSQSGHWKFRVKSKQLIETGDDCEALAESVGQVIAQRML